jgi:hypothetical protein
MMGACLTPQGIGRSEVMLLPTDGKDRDANFPAKIYTFAASHCHCMGSLLRLGCLFPGTEPFAFLGCTGHRP